MNMNSTEFWKTIETMFNVPNLHKKGTKTWSEATIEMKNVL